MTRRLYANGLFCACHRNKLQKNKRLVKTARQSEWSRTSSSLTEFLPDDLHAMTKLMLSSKDNLAEESSTNSQRVRCMAVIMQVARSDNSFCISGQQRLGACCCPSSKKETEE